MADNFETIIIPEIKTSDISYWYSNEVLKWWQIDASNNRQISKVQYFAFKVNCIWWPTTFALSNTKYALIYSWKNWDTNKSFTELFLEWSWAGEEYTWNITKYSTIDTHYESNWATQVPIDIVIPSWKICEVVTSFLTSTQILRLDIITGSVQFLYWYNSTPILLSTANPNSTFFSSSTTSLKLRLNWLSTTNSPPYVTERPSFWIFIKIY